MKRFSDIITSSRERWFNNQENFLINSEGFTVGGAVESVIAHTAKPYGLNLNLCIDMIGDFIILFSFIILILPYRCVVILY